jgi:hypothetical protein
MRKLCLVACTAAVALSVAGCLGGVRQRPVASSFGAEAVAWREARYAAGGACVANLDRFFDKRAVVEDRVEARRVYTGRSAFLEHYHRSAMNRGIGTCDPAEPLGLFLSADEILDQFSLPARVSWDPAIEDGMVLGTVGPHGYTHVIMSASVEHWRGAIPPLPGLDRLEGLATRYVALWNGDPSVDAAHIYDTATSVEDTLEGFSVHGLEELRATVGTGRWPDLPPMRISPLPVVRPGASAPASAPRGQAVYVGPAVASSTESDVMVLLLQVDDGSGCPGVVGVAIAVDHGRISRERRYHAVDAVRRCFDTSTLQPGWWEDLDIPAPVVHELTGTATWSDPDRSVAVYNGTPAMNTYVRWGLKRFADAGLTPPKVDAVSFALDQHVCPIERRGYVRYDAAGADVSLCYEPDQVCDDAGCATWTERAAQTLLHEFAHVWMYQNLTEDTKSSFMRQVGVSRWADPDDDWGDRGVERAANTMMAGLMAEPLAMDPAACGAFGTRFSILTGVRPLAPCSP